MKNIIKTDGNHNIIELQLTVLVFQEGDFFVSYCPSLNLSSYGNSIQDAKDGFDEVMHGYIEDCQRDGTLPEDLANLGWKFKQGAKTSKAEPPAMVEVDIPAGILRRQFNENWRVPVC